MKTGPVTSSDLARSVLSVPPMARRADLSLDRDENGRLLAHLRAGGVRTFMYGGNANLYHMGVSEYAPFCEMLESLAEEGDWFIPSVGSDFGKALDQIGILRDLRFPTAMVLPHRFPMNPAGVATGLRRLADAYGRPVIAYVKDNGYIEAKDLGRLHADGVIAAVKYAIVRDDPKTDPFLDEMLEGVDRSIVISGIGERPAIDHFTYFGLKAFTSGSVCVGPHLSTAILKALQAGDVAEAERIRTLFLPLEDLRDGHSPLRVLHEAVRLAGIAETGPMLPFLSNLADPTLLAEIKAASMQLLEVSRTA